MLRLVKTRKTMKRSRLRRRFRPKDFQPGFQIAPMVDVVFVILLFFMIASAEGRKEKAHTTQLPGGLSAVVADEVVIWIDADGLVSVNDEPVDDEESRKLPELTASLKTMARAADDSGVTLSVVIRSESTVKYQRIVDVLDAIVRARVKGVSFQALEE